MGRSDTSGPSFMFFDLATRQTRRLAVLSPTSACLRADVAPNGEWAVFAQVDHGGTDIMLMEHL